MRRETRGRVCWKLFAFSGTDREAAQEWLERQNAAGWRLQGMYGGLLARLEQDSRNVVRGCVRPSPTRREVRADYYQHWTDAGWERAAGSWGLELFQSQPGRLPFPPKDDPAAEELRLERQARWSGWGAVLTVVLSLLWTGWLGWSNVLLSSIHLAGSLVLLAINVVLAGYGISLCSRQRRRRRVRLQGGTVQSGRFWAARLRYFCGGGAGVLLCALLLLNGLQAAQREEAGALTTGPLVTAEALGLEGSGSLYGQEGRSVLVAWSHTQEFLREGDAPAGTVVCDVYRCANPFTARLLAGFLRMEEAQGRTQHLLERHGRLALTPAELGFDRAWMAQDGTRNCLLAVEGAVVVMIEAPAELDRDEITALLLERM